MQKDFIDTFWEIKARARDARGRAASRLTQNRGKHHVYNRVAHEYRVSTYTAEVDRRIQKKRIERSRGGCDRIMRGGRGAKKSAGWNWFCRNQEGTVSYERGTPVRPAEKVVGVRCSLY